MAHGESGLEELEGDAVTTAKAEGSTAARRALSEAAQAEARYAHRKKAMRVTMVALAHVLFAALVILVLLPEKRVVPTIVPFLVAILLTEALYLWALARKDANRAAYSWVVIIVWAFFFIWELFSTQLGTANPVLFPAPEAVFNVFPTQWPTLLDNLVASLQLLAMGALTAIVAGLVLGAICGWLPGLRGVFAPIARVLAPIPSVVFAPYIILLMPTFRVASATIIFLGIFWPMFLNTIIRVTSMDKRIVEGARHARTFQFRDGQRRHLALPASWRDERIERTADRCHHDAHLRRDAWCEFGTWLLHHQLHELRELRERHRGHHHGGPHGDGAEHVD